MLDKQRTELNEEEKSYVVPKKNRKMDVIAFVICFLVALLIWIYATNTENKEKTEGAEGGTVAAASIADTEVLSALGDRE